ncbi:unnamed protein product [Prunus armeniaca]
MEAMRSKVAASRLRYLYQLFAWCRTASLVKYAMRAPSNNAFQGICRTDLSSACYSLDPHGCSIMVLPFGKLGDADCRGAKGLCRRALKKGRMT